MSSFVRVKYGQMNSRSTERKRKRWCGEYKNGECCEREDGDYFEGLEKEKRGDAFHYQADMHHLLANCQLMMDNRERKREKAGCMELGGRQQKDIKRPTRSNNWCCNGAGSKLSILQRRMKNSKEMKKGPWIRGNSWEQKTAGFCSQREAILLDGFVPHS